ncbi:polyketide cyclase / dehydrase and lipid transport family protein [Orientia chuto str. Dubai]|uniref:Polyketide cyclase / dehydrase and lipid transport family protein n=1 Tax=Orientia chuto str. Dubai TaxID=1359168 RepID=A0A0F3MPT5_9RICK|nr:type II toxin-antitoxin system RatA family toxin [Candidatus Orientia mediorientalis]KJV57477.1 polyketide cyclase / dehydrase and lipid transport family protein [Orientia chuto str. Dubai]
MLFFNKAKFLPYSSKNLYQLVLDIESYPQFIPYCSAVEIIKKNSKFIIADLTIKFKLFSDRYRSLVMLQSNNKNYSIIVKSIGEGPILHLSNIWKFQFQEQQNTLVTLDLKLTLKSIILEKFIKLVADDIAYKTMIAFENRAKQTYGKTTTFKNF